MGLLDLGINEWSMIGGGLGLLGSKNKDSFARNQTQMNQGMKGLLTQREKDEAEQKKLANQNELARVMDGIKNKTITPEQIPFVIAILYFYVQDAINAFLANPVLGTPLMQNLSSAGYVPGSPEWKEAMITSINKPTTTVNNNVGNGPGYKLPANYMENPSFKPDQPITAENSPIAFIPNGPADPSVSSRVEGAKLDMATDSTEDSFKRYRDTLNKYGTRLIPSKEKFELQTAYKDLQLEIKELFNLGVLAGPDMELIEAYVQDPTSIKGNIYDLVGGPEMFDAQLNLVELKIAAARKKRDRLTDTTQGGSNKDNKLKELQERAKKLGIK